MTSLHHYLGARHRRNPHGEALYLGLDGIGRAQWQIMGTVYTDSVTTVGGGSPTVGRWYPAFCGDPDSWRNWAVLVRARGRVLPYAPSEPALSWLTFRNGYDRRNRWEQEDPWLPPSLRVPVVEPEALLTYPVILRVYQGEVYEFAGDDLSWSGRVPPWYMTPLQRGQYRSTLTAPVSPSDSTIYVVSTAGLGWDHPLVIGEEEFELWDYGDDWIAVGRSTGATSHAEGSVVTQELEEPEELPRWWDFVVVDGGALIQIYPYSWWEIPDGPTYDGENSPENGDIPKLQRRDNAGDVLWDWPFPAIEVTYPDDGSPGGSGGGAT